MVAKTELFNKELQEKANLFKALSHPVRLQILQFLAQTHTCLSGDISDKFPLTRTTLNQHMDTLKEAGLISGHTRDGKIYYCLNLSMIKQMTNILSGFIQIMHLPEDFCCN